MRTKVVAYNRIAFNDRKLPLPPPHVGGHFLKVGVGQVDLIVAQRNARRAQERQRILGRLVKHAGKQPTGLRITAGRIQGRGKLQAKVDVARIESIELIGLAKGLPMIADQECIPHRHREHARVVGHSLKQFGENRLGLGWMPKLDVERGRVQAHPIRCQRASGNRLPYKLLRLGSLVVQGVEQRERQREIDLIRIPRDGIG